MKISQVLLLLIILTSQISTQSNISDEKSILQEKLDEFNTAFKYCDIDKLTSLTTENYLHTNGSSRPINKAIWLDYLNNRKKEIESGELKISRYEMQDTQIEIYNNIGIITAKIIVESIQSGVNRLNEYRVTNIWIKEDGIWKRAGFHDGEIK